MTDPESDSTLAPPPASPHDRYLSDPDVIAIVLFNTLLNPSGLHMLWLPRRYLASLPATLTWTSSPPPARKQQPRVLADYICNEIERAELDANTVVLVLTAIASLITLHGDWSDVDRAAGVRCRVLADPKPRKGANALLSIDFLEAAAVRDYADMVEKEGKLPERDVLQELREQMLHDMPAASGARH